MNGSALEQNRTKDKLHRHLVGCVHFQISFDPSQRHSWLNTMGSNQNRVLRSSRSVGKHLFSGLVGGSITISGSCPAVQVTFTGAESAGDWMLFQRCF
jgi:hypothetical protein